MVQTPWKRKFGTKPRRTETKPEIWTVQENCQNSTGTDQKHSRRHGLRRKGRDLRRHIRRRFYCHHEHAQNFLSNCDRLKDEIYALSPFLSYSRQSEEMKPLKQKSYSVQEQKDYSWTRIPQKNTISSFRNSRTRLLLATLTEL